MRVNRPTKDNNIRNLLLNKPAKKKGKMSAKAVPNEFLPA